MDITLNKLFKYVYENHGSEKAAEVYRTLKKLKEKPRKLELISQRALSAGDAVEALDICCEWLSDKDKHSTYFFQLDECELYDVFHLAFKKEDPTFLERLQAGKTFNNAIDILAEAGYFDSKGRNAYSWNCFYFYYNDGFLWPREIPEFLDILFKSKLKPDYKLIAEIS